MIKLGSRRILKDMKNHEGLDSFYLPSASPDNTNIGFNDSSYPTRPHSFGLVV
jgi:hypothetical protein